MSRSCITDKGSGMQPPKPTSEWFGYKYRVTPESSKLLQEAVFKDGGSWLSGCTKIQYEEHEWLSVRSDGKICFGLSDIPEKQPPQPSKVEPTKKEAEPKEFKVGKYYKCISGYSFSKFTVGCYYKLFKVSGLLLFSEDMYNYVHRELFDINSESDYDPNAKKVVDTEVKGSNIDVTVTGSDLSEGKDVTVTLIRRFDGLCAEVMKPTQVNKFNQQEEIDMSTNNQRKTVTVNLIDRDTALDEKFALVATFGEFTTSKSSEALIRSIIIDPKNKVAELITQHNEVRVKQTNKEIMERTGNKVTLEAVEESDLYWEIR